MTGDELVADLPNRVYDSTELNSADFYLTDLPLAVFTTGADVSNMTGTIIHIHMFMQPKAGSTPIARTASSSTVRVMVLAGGEIGVYGGGGFFARSGSAGDKSFGGRISKGTLRLVRATPGFSDLLGPSEFSGTFSAKRDAAMTESMARAMSALSSYTQSVE